VFDRLSQWLYRISSGWASLMAVIIFLVFTIVVLPGQAANSEAQTGGGGSPDTSLLYSPRNLYSWAQSYGQAGRSAYVRARLTFDLVWPWVYTSFLCISISWLYAKVSLSDHDWRYANLAPILALLFDYLENISTSLVMLRYPAKTPLVDWLAPIFTLAKWSLVAGSFILLLAGMGTAALRWARKNPKMQE
jgi:hypothetical protein